MSADPGPQLTGVHHLSPTVRDVGASAAWYQELFGMVRLPNVLEHHDRESTGYADVLVEPTSGISIGLHHHTDGGRDRFDEGRTGLDHIGFSAPPATTSTLGALAGRVGDRAHTGVRDIPGPAPISTLLLRDPDNIQLELVRQT